MKPQTLGTIREFKTRHFTVCVDALEDYDVDLSFDDTGEVRKQLERGDLICFTARATVYYLGTELATDYLGGCIYESLADFMDHKECGAQTRKLRAEGSNAVCGSYFADMVKSVCEEARTEIAKMQTIKVRK